jgi:DNA-binding ferritin-like protein
MVGSLIRYSDTHKFFEKHYDEIGEIRDELQES